MPVNTLLIKKLLIFGFLCGLTLSISARCHAQDEIHACIGKAQGNKWDARVMSFLSSWLTASGLSSDIHYTPAKRAEFEFKHGKCNLFFAAPKQFDILLSRNNIFRIDVPVFSVRLNVYKKFQHQETDSVQETTYHQLNEPNTRIAYFSTLTLSNYMRTFEHADLVEVTEINRGFSLLEKDRIDYFVAPDLDISFPDDLKVQKGKMKKLKPLYKGELYIWVDSRFLSFKTALETSLKEHKRSSQWQDIFAPLLPIDHTDKTHGLVPSN